MATNKKNDEHPLANILINVIVPVVILSMFSKDPALQELLGNNPFSPAIRSDHRPWHRLSPEKQFPGNHVEVWGFDMPVN
jgi:hypothetical protein